MLAFSLYICVENEEPQKVVKEPKKKTKRCDTVSYECMEHQIR